MLTSTQSDGLSSLAIALGTRDPSPSHGTRELTIQVEQVLNTELKEKRVIVGVDIGLKCQRNVRWVESWLMLLSS